MYGIDFLRVNECLWGLWLAYWIFAARATQRTKKSERKLHRLLLLGALALGFYLIFKNNDHWLVNGQIFDGNLNSRCGTGMTIAGLCFAIWARFHLGKYWSGTITLKYGHKLIRSGPYGISRHPIYTGFLLAVLGSASVTGTLDSFCGFTLILVAYIVKIRSEEKVLVQEFGDEYKRFEKEVWTLLPYLY